jgi:hypothetical protein
LEPVVNNKRDPNIERRSMVIVGKVGVHIGGRQDVSSRSYESKNIKSILQFYDMIHRYKIEIKEKR